MPRKSSEPEKKSKATPSKNKRPATKGKTTKPVHRLKLSRWMVFMGLKVLLVILILFALSSYLLLRYALTPISETRDIQGSYNEMFSEFPYLRHWTDSLNKHSALLDTTIYASDSTLLHGLMIRGPKSTPNTAVLIHGYTQNAVRMLHLAYLYNHDLRFNVLIPDLRHSGESGGDHIQMGWKDCDDVRLWMEIGNRRFGGQTRMVVHGVSMGAFCAMCLSGGKQPAYVKAYVEDCGYTSVHDIFKYRMRRQFGLPSWPLLNLSSQMCRWYWDWDFEEADCRTGLSQSTLPMLFIHGGGDTYVPTEMVYELYQQKPRDKYIWVAPKATHARSFQSNPSEYQHQVRSFLNMFLYK